MTVPPGFPTRMPWRHGWPTSRDQAIAKGRVLVHVIADQATVDGRDNQPAFMDGHGVISAAHLRDLLARDDVRVRPLNPQSGEQARTSLPTYLPSDPYRPSTALDTFIRARDGYCTIPGCDQPAWKCDIDHVQEYDHDNPGEGGHQPRRTRDEVPDAPQLQDFRPRLGRRPIPRQQWPLVSEVVSQKESRFPDPPKPTPICSQPLTTHL